LNLNHGDPQLCFKDCTKFKRTYLARKHTDSTQQKNASMIVLNVQQSSLPKNSVVVSKGKMSKES